MRYRSTCLSRLQHAPYIPIPAESPSINTCPCNPSRLRIQKYPHPSLTLASRQNKTLPLLHLPYATYRASHYDPIDDIYIFSNIRYASIPTGENRFKAPQTPIKASKVQDGSIGHSCYQSTPTQFLLARPALEGLTQSEDCLFLDLFLPGRVVRSRNVKEEKLAVVHWIFGGGFGRMGVSLC